MSSTDRVREARLHSVRGAALVETAAGISLALMLILGMAQMALIGYAQLSADGASFVAARAAVAQSSASPAAVAHSVFGGVAAADLTPSPAPGTDAYSVTKTIPGFSIPGFNTNYTIGGGDVEVAATPPPVSGPYFSIGFNATLYNYCYPGTTCSFPAAHSMYLAQTILPGGSGVNGQFQEWGCHDGYFDALLSDFPSSMPSSITAGSELDMTTSGTDEYKIYSWDGGTACS